MTHISIIDFKVLYTQVNGVIQNYIYLTISVDFKITTTAVLFMFFIISNIVSMAAVPITHQGIIIEYRHI